MNQTAAMEVPRSPADYWSQLVAQRLDALVVLVADLCRSLLVGLVKAPIPESDTATALDGMLTVAEPSRFTSVEGRRRLGPGREQAQGMPTTTGY